MQYEQLKQMLKQFKHYFPPGLQRLGVQTWRTIEIPLAAVLERRSIIDAHRVVWPDAEVADFDRCKILGPTADEILVEVAFTVMSPGTERAQLLGLPGFWEHVPGIPGYPGYSGSGEVLSVGKKVTGFQMGDRVAGRIKHGSPDVVQGQWLFRVPDEVPLEKAALIELGIIVLQGIRKARIRPGESVLVLGQGLIGQLANRLSRLAGGAPIVAVAKSKAKAPEALGKGGADRFLTVEELNREGVGEGFDVVIEATGDPNALPFASSLARAGGRVILLGTPWGRTSLNLGQDGCRPGLTLIGAHITGMPQRDRSNGLWTYRDEGHLFLDLLAQGRLFLDDLITQRIDPSRAGEIYESLRSGGPRIIGVVFDWTGYGSNKKPTETGKDFGMKQTTSPSFRLSKRWFTWKVDFEETPTDALPPEKRLRVGIVGGGDIGLRNAYSVQAAPAAIVAAVCDINPEVLRDLARRFNVPAMSDYESLLARSDVDAVLLSVPNMLHAPLAIQAAQAGKHVLVEKPMGVNLHDATRIVEACRQTGVRLTVNFSFRYRPAIQVARELVQDGILGEICGIHVNLLIFRGASFWASGDTSRSPANWRGSKEKAGGGILIMLTCHEIDYLRYCTGLEVKRISSEYGTFASPVEVEDAIVVNSQYDNGSIGSITASTCWRGTPSAEVRIWGTHGALRIEESYMLSFKLSYWSARRWRGLAPAKEHHLHKLPQIDYTAKWIHRFAMALANDEPHEITGKDGWINNAVIEAAYLSRDQGQAVEVEAFPWKDES